MSWVVFDVETRQTLEEDSVFVRPQQLLAPAEILTKLGVTQEELSAARRRGFFFPCALIIRMLSLSQKLLGPTGLRSLAYSVDIPVTHPQVCGWGCMRREYPYVPNL